MKETASCLILLAHPDPVSREVLAQVLEPEARLQFADSGAEALRLAVAEPPDLALIDSDLPGADGYSLCRSLLQLPKLSELPVLVLCAGGDPIPAFRAGAVDVVEKPFRAEILLARVRAQVSLHRARQRIAERNAEYEHLLHVLCHDLWNPIAAARGFIRLAKRADVEGKVREYCANVERCLGHQEDIIERVRELRAHESGKIALIAVPVPLAAVIDSAAALMWTRLEEKGLRLARPAPEALNGLAVWSEPVSLTHGVLCNLISNAIKFSHPGGTIRIGVGREGERCTLTVQDDGVGIPASLLPRLFQLNAATTRVGTAGERGTGFGLPLVRRVLQRFGGDIAIDSHDESEHPEAHGTTIQVHLRLASPAA